MIVVTINKDGSEKEIKFRSHPSEITLAQYTEMQILLQDAPEHIAPMLDGGSEDLPQWTPWQWQEFFIFIASVLSIFTDEDFEALLDIPQTPKSGLIEEDAGHSLVALFYTITNAIGQYAPKERSKFVHNGITYLVPSTLTRNISAPVLGPGISTIEAVEALQLQHVLGVVTDDKLKMIDRRYKTDLGVMACLCRAIGKDGKVEQMPLDINQRRAFVEKRMMIFESVTMDVAFDVSFFLTNSSEVLKIIPLLGMFLKQATIPLSKQFKGKKHSRAGRYLGGTTRLRK